MTPMAGDVILLVGSGGREHALAWKLSRDSSRPRIYCAPGNAGTAGVGTNIAIQATDLQGLLQWAREHRPRLTVVGPEAPLCAGLADLLAAERLPVFGPCAAAARLEGSKLFAKDVMIAAGVPTADARSFTEPGPALEYVRSLRGACVVKADGLAAGKGVTVCASPGQAEAAIEEAMVKRAFGESGNTVIVEECLEGEEASILALVDGERVVLLASSQDHKRIFDRDQGPNTGGMGAYSPAPVVGDEHSDFLLQRVFHPVIGELRKRGIAYRGVLYAGLMMTSRGPQVLEFNCRFGDPETQAILPRWDGDMLPALEACATGRLQESMVRWSPGACVCVVMTAGGYPGNYATGAVIEGLADADAGNGVVVFHAGTKLDGRRVVTAGGRVLGVTALGSDLRDAVSKAYQAAGKIRFENAHFRRDIAWRALAGTAHPPGSRRGP
jgi:phosphoribosylamine---glycine ligase